MDKAYEMHLNVNRARIVGETLKYLNSRLGIMKDLTKDQAYYLTASAFRTYAFDEQDWNALKEKDEFFPEFLKEAKSLPYKSAIKKISDELWEKSNPNREKEEQERLEKERQENPELNIPVVKPDSVKPTEVLQQSILPIRKKEPPKPQVQTIEIKNDKKEQAEDIFAPVPIDTTPID